MTFLLIIIALLICVVLGFVLLVLHSLPKRQPFQLRGKHTLVTGGSKGIGRCIAAELLAAGCRVVSIVARDQAALEKTKEELEAKYCDQSEGGQRVRIYSMDVAESSTEKIQELVTEMEADSGPVDLLVNNAGFCFQGAFDELPADAFERQMRVNFFSAVNFTRAVLQSMKRKGAGHIAFVSSAAGQCAIWGYSAYSPSKFALRALADVLHAELRPHGIGVSVLFPPNTATEGFQEEQRTMPEQVRLISNSAGVFSPEQVASAFVGSLRTGQFWTCLGMEGKMLGLLAAAASPEPNPLKALAQICLAGLVRGVMLIYGGQFDAVIQKCHDQQEQQKKKISEKEAAEEKSE